MKGRIKKIIDNDVFLSKIRRLLDDKEAYLAGGYIRDLALKGGASGVVDAKNTAKERLSDFNKSANSEEANVSRDRDIVLFNADTEKVSRNIADSLGAAFVELDNENKIYRIVAGDDYADIAQGLNNDIDDDINRRDFCINSIFYNLNTDEFYDKNNGFNDLEKRIIRTYDIKNLEDDPLRMLRAYRFKAQVGFNIDSDIIDFIKNNAKSLDVIAKERVNQEILKTFDGDFLVPALLEMFDTGLLEAVFPFVREIKKIPANTHHHLDLVHHSIETVKNIRIKKPLLRLAAFYHDIGKPLCWTIEADSGRHRFIGHDEKGGELVKKELAGLKFSNKQIDYVSKMVKHHIYPSALMCQNADTDEVSKKAMARFVRKIHPDVEDLIELARADRLSARGEAISDDMVNENLNNLQKLLDYYKSVQNTLQEMPKLLNGKEIMEILDIKPGPHLGEIIDKLKEAQIMGEVKNKEEAKTFVEKHKV